MYDLFGDKFDLNHDGRLSAAEHMMDFSVFNYWATDDDDDDDDGVDRDRSSESTLMNLSRGASRGNVKHRNKSASTQTNITFKL